jgi:hypothetical protein
MTRLVHDSKLESRAARTRLAPRGQPYYRALEPGHLHLGYRKPLRGAGKWLARIYAEGKYSYHPLGIADDFSDADGDTILSFKQAQIAARGGGYHQSQEQRIVNKALDFLARDVEPGAYLYRHYHPNGDLLYVGFSLNPLRRQRDHHTPKGAGWRGMICRILIEPFETREQALAAEEVAIRDEFPVFNTTYNTRRHPFQEIQREKD